MKEQKLRRIIREEIQKELNEVGTQQRRILRPKQLRNLVNGKTVKDAAATGDQWQLEFPNNERLLIKNPDKLLFNEAT